MKKLIINLSFSMFCGVVGTFTALYVLACFDGAINKTEIGKASLKPIPLAITLLGTTGICFMLLTSANEETK